MADLKLRLFSVIPHYTTLFHSLYCLLYCDYCTALLPITSSITATHRRYMRQEIQGNTGHRIFLSLPLSLLYVHVDIARHPAPPSHQPQPPVRRRLITHCTGNNLYHHTEHQYNNTPTLLQQITRRTRTPQPGTDHPLVATYPRAISPSQRRRQNAIPTPLYPPLHRHSSPCPTHLTRPARENNSSAAETETTYDCHQGSC